MKDALGNNVELGGYLIASWNSAVIIGYISVVSDFDVVLTEIMPPQVDEVGLKLYVIALDKFAVAKSLFVRKSMTIKSGFTLEHK